MSLTPVKVPDFSLNVTSYLVEEAVFFDEALRSGLTRKLQNKSLDQEMRDSRVIPAVEYVQSQRARMVMMMMLDQATKDVDVWIARATPACRRAGRRRPRCCRRTTCGSRWRRTWSRHTAEHHAAALHHGAAGAIRRRDSQWLQRRRAANQHYVFRRPFGESELLAVVKAYQDATGYHLKHPKLES